MASDPAITEPLPTLADVDAHLHRRRVQLAVKRAVDVLGAALLLVVLGPAIALVGATQSGTASLGRVAYVVGGVLVTCGGLVTLITGARWPAAASRFRRSETSASAGADNPADLWQAMDAGLDPTADPDVRKGDSGDTMRRANQS